uniref:NADH dehydrogenase subunit 6 n=1 Tax=Pulchriphyllium giganteum TaxID=591861 RepID=UPI0025A9F1E1|nr:NADH dehydrogenase subunit 6 [Pulchriphyllium giganteum]WID87117.1 NADH dehydrogenase subunit 6 [Pulchriphyllium giganteum]
MKLLMITNMMLNTTFLMMKHPLSMSMTIITQTMIVSMITSMMWMSSWYSFILVLTYIGGMMIMFIYMTSLVPNMMFSMPKKMTMSMIIMLTIMMTYMINKKYQMLNLDMMQPNEQTIILTKMYTKPTNITTIMMALYLLFTMITVKNMTELKMGPLRMKFN